MVDLDQGGFPFQRTRAYFGPSLGWKEVQVKPELFVVAGGTTVLPAGTSLVLVNVAALVTIQLPSVVSWVQEVALQPTTAFDRSIWVKDLGYNATNFNITIAPFSGNTIDGQGSFSIITNGDLIRLYPLINLTGWFVG